MPHPRIGLIVPSSNTTMEVELNRLIPQPISLHVARMRMPRDIMFQNPKEIDDLEDEAEKAAISLADAEVQAIAYGCTTGSFYRGKTHDATIRERLKKTSGVSSVVTTAGAIVEALNSLHVTRLVVLTPYVESTNRRMKLFLESTGFNVLKMEGMGLTDNMAIAQTDQEKTISIARNLKDPAAEAFLISCTNLRTIDMIDELEDEIKIPVLTSNTSTLWSILQRVDDSVSLSRGGQLFRGSRNA